MEKTYRNRLVAISLVLAVVFIAFVGVFATIGINDSMQTASAGNKSVVINPENQDFIFLEPCEGDGWRLTARDEDATYYVSLVTNTGTADNPVGTYSWSDVVPGEGFDGSFIIPYNEDSNFHRATGCPNGFTVTEVENGIRFHGVFTYDNDNAYDIDITYETEQQGGDLEPVSYMDWNGTSLVEKTGEDACKEYTVVTDDNTEWTTGWYVASSDVTINGGVSFGSAESAAQVHLILCDGVTLNINGGDTKKNAISGEGNGTTFTIYGQSQGTGKLNARDGNNENSGIYFPAGEITINGGEITAVGGIAIACDIVKINGGKIVANGKYSTRVARSTAVMLPPVPVFLMQ